jgi:DNA-binding HxlR family transcriptional regulator
MSELEVFGTRCLELLSDAATVTVLAYLRRQPASALDIEHARLGIEQRVALARLRALVGHGLVGLLDREGSRSARLLRHRLRRSGDAIQTVIEVAADCESGWPGGTHALTPGVRALTVAGDPESRAIARALAYQRLRLGELEVLLPEITHGTLVRRLRDRAAQGLIHSTKEGREAWHGLTAAARRLATIPLYAARWEWAHGDRDKALLGSDLAGLVHQLAPLVRLREEVNGVCLLHEDWHSTFQSDIYLAARGGGISPIVTPPSSVGTSGEGTPEQWVQALIADEPMRLIGTGDPTLLSAVVSGLHGQLCRPRRTASSLA